jgi:F-type H+-transporting ATPase subunit delta
MSAYKLASRYAKSLMDLAIEKGKVEVLFNDIHTILSLIKNSPPLAAMLRNPVIKTDKKIKVAQLILADKIDTISLAFLTIIFNKRREPYLADICEAFIALYNQSHGIVPVKLITAVEPDAATLEQVKTLVKNKTNSTKIELHSTIDTSLIGGFVLEFENKLYDNSVKRQLQLLSKNFTNPIQN